MFRLLKRDRSLNEDGNSLKPTKVSCNNGGEEDDDFDSTQITQELNYEEEERVIGDELTPSCVLLSDYESDSLQNISFDSTTISSTSSTTSSSSSSSSNTKTTRIPRQRKRGGLKRHYTTSTGTRGFLSNNSSVSFGNVHIRTHEICVGDNPAVSLGVPVSLDWHVVSETVMPLYEKDHDDNNHPTVEAEISIPAAERDEWVRKRGATTEEIREAVRMVNTIKMEREKTLDTLNNSSSEYFMEKLRKSVWNATVRRRTKKMEREQLQQWLEKDAAAIAAQKQSQERNLILITPAC